jgi:hypothetical protein
LKKVYTILLKHYLIGLIVTASVFASIGEFPTRFFFQLRLTEWTATFLSIPIVGLFLSNLLFRQIRKNEKNLYLKSLLTILSTWILVLYSKAATVGFFDSLEKGQSKFIDAIIGFTIYQLWIFIGIGIIHGLIGGVFLKMDLKKNLEKIKNGTQQRL